MKRLALASLACSSLLVVKVEAGLPRPKPSMLEAFRETKISGIVSEEVPLPASGSPTPSPVAQTNVFGCPGEETFIDICFESDMDIVQDPFPPAPGFTVSRIPPDPHGAAGPNSVIAVTNTEIEAREKATGEVIFGPVLLQTMFTGDLGSPIFPGFPASNTFDPKILFDTHEERFVVVVLDAIRPPGGVVRNSSILVAVSKSSNPTSTSTDDWFFLRIPSTISANGVELWADYPGIAVDEEALYITNNMFRTDRMQGQQTSLLWIVDKSKFYDGSDIDGSWRLYDFVAEALPDPDLGLTPFRFGTHMPAMVRPVNGIGGAGSDFGTYLFRTGISNTANGVDLIQLIGIVNPVANPTFQTFFVSLEADIFVPTNDNPDAPQPETNEEIETNDSRALDAVWVNDELWMVWTIEDSVGETSAYWAKFSADGTNPPGLLDQGAINGEDIGSNTFTYFPSIDVNSNGIAAFGFSASSPTIFGSAYATIRDDNNDPMGTVRTPDLVKAGTAPYLVNFGGENRWGDYTGMALDPVDTDCFWAFNQYAIPTCTTFPTPGQFGCWKTAWARLCFPGAPATTDSSTSDPITTDSTSTQAPDTTTQAPDSTTQAPDTTTQAPDSTTQAPDTTTQAPDSTTQAPDTTTQAPDTTTQAPDTTTQAPDTTTQAPDSTTQATDQTTTETTSDPGITETTDSGMTGTETTDSSVTTTEVGTTTKKGDDDDDDSKVKKLSKRKKSKDKNGGKMMMMSKGKMSKGKKKRKGKDDSSDSLSDSDESTSGKKGRKKYFMNYMNAHW